MLIELGINRYENISMSLLQNLLIFCSPSFLFLLSKFQNKMDRVLNLFQVTKAWNIASIMSNLEEQF